MADKDDKELQMLRSRLKDLANRSYQQGIYTFTDFIGLSEQDVFWHSEPDWKGSTYRIWGGRENADRVVIRFGSPEDLGYEIDFPIACIHVKPDNMRFAEELSHRDFLGALMNLGIERSILGDIIVGEKEAFFFCLNTMADFICEKLDKVRHTNVTCTITEDFKEPTEREPELQMLQVASARADAVIAKVFRFSRQESRKLFSTGKVFVNGRCCDDLSKELKAEDIVSVRGYGKFRYVGDMGETRKGKSNVKVAIYR